MKTNRRVYLKVSAIAACRVAVSIGGIYLISLGDLLGIRSVSIQDQR